ncbi:MAG: AAA family ATPase [Candidatus Diapherotrites archaeon]|nr:AAA family ATPase [Candidatus Diapherotrites archaeon]
MIIGLTGPARSGKDTVAHYLMKEYGFKQFDFYHDVFLKELEKRGLEPTKDNASRLGDELRKEGGMGVMANMLFPIIDAEDAVITGFRSPQEVEFFRAKTAHFFLLMASAPREMRYTRRDDSDPQDKKAFFGRDERDLKNKGMETVFMMADHIIRNEGTLKELHERIDEVMEEIQGGEESD